MEHNALLKVGLILLFCSVMAWRVRLVGGSEASPVDTVAGLRIAQIGIVLFIGMLKFRSASFHHLLFGLLPFMLIYSCVGILSTLFSSAPGYTLYKATETIIAVIFIASILGSCDNIDKFIEFMVITIGAFLFMEISIWLGMLVSPQLAFRAGKSLFGSQLSGVFPVFNANKVGFISAVLILAAPFGVIVSKVKEDRIFFMTITLLTIPVFMLAQARTSLIGTFCACLLFLMLNKKFKYITVICVLAGILLTWDSFGNLMASYLKKGENDLMLETLTGRTTAWNYAWEMFKKSPIFGYGFASGARFDVLKNNGAVGLHGSIFDVLVNLGLLGVIPWLVAIIGTWIQLLLIFFRYSKQMTPKVRLFHTFMLSVLVLSTFRAFTGTTLVGHDLEFVIFLLILGYAQLSAKHRGFTKVNETSPVNSQKNHFDEVEDQRIRMTGITR